MTMMPPISTPKPTSTRPSRRWSRSIRAGRPCWSAPDGRRCAAARAAYAGLAQIIVSQQVSVASAAAIHGRLVAIGDPFDHTSVLRARKDKLLRVGLSNAKVRTLKEIAKAVERRADRSRIARSTCPPTTRMRRLIRCTASARGPPTSICSSCIGHADAWPAGDLALQEAARLAFGLRNAPDHQGDGPARRRLAALQGGRGAAALDVLSRGEEPRRPHQPAEPCGDRCRAKPKKKRAKHGRATRRPAPCAGARPRAPACRVPARLWRRRQRPDRDRQGVAGPAAACGVRLAACAAPVRAGADGARVVSAHLPQSGRTLGRRAMRRRPGSTAFSMPSLRAISFRHRRSRWSAFPRAP